MPGCLPPPPKLPNVHWCVNLPMPKRMPGSPLLQVLYILKTEVSCRALLRQDRSIATSVRWLAADRSHPLNVLTTRVCRRCGVLRPEEELDAETWKTKVPPPRALPSPILWPIGRECQIVRAILTPESAAGIFKSAAICKDAMTVFFQRSVPIDSPLSRMQTIWQGGRRSKGSLGGS